MEGLCLCCLSEATVMYSVTIDCSFPPEECYENGIPPHGRSAVPLGELYSAVLQLSLVPLSSEICARCVAVLKEYYLFRARAQKSHEELQTKASIAKIISHLEQSSSVGSVHPERLREDFGEDDPEPDSRCVKGPFRCAVCQKMFKMRKLLLRHEEVHHRRHHEAPDHRFHCPHCDKHFASKASRSGHVSKVHRQGAPDDWSRCMAKKRAEHRCSTCESRFSTARLLKEHNETMHRNQHGEATTRKNSFPCDLCSKIFTRRSSLNAHKMVLHAGIRQHSCQICSRAFGKEDSLKTHLALHTGKLHRCKLCGKAFAKAGFLRKHLEQHESTDGGRKFACAVCSKGFTTKSHLADHELIHSGQRPYRCNVCGSSFRQKQQLKVHSYQHFGKPFRCGECSAEFGVRARLQAHTQAKHHAKDQPEREAPSPTTNVVQPDFGDKVVNEEILDEICYQIDSNPIILQSIEADGMNLICNNTEPIVFLADGNGDNLL
ncbi:zinc finger protein 2-like [Anopheles cruzii]|uniref:zinc finger protein 2-like n=1 Tax=Anopheles cruzii TaxID=68878 RepID=UPI0022EC3AC0|nr:zinc finger protein 2-like [Anopheles cruzii]